MKILTIVEGLGLGGTERVAQNFSIGYQKFNCQSKVLATQNMGVRADLLENEGIEVLDGSKDLAASIKIIKTWQPNIIHIHRPGYFNEMNGILSSLKSENTKVIETNIFARPDYSRSAHLVDVHLLLSNWCMWKWQQWTSGSNQIGAVIPNLVDCDKFIKKTDEVISHPSLLSLPQDAVVLGRIGQPIPAKWDEMIFDVLEDLLQQSDAYFLVLIGLPEVLKRKLNTYDKKVRDHVILVGTIHNDDELNAIYQRFNIFLHASGIGESFGMVLAEAHLNKIPIITLNTPLKDNSQNEIVGNNRGGFVVSDKTNMLKAVKILANNKELCATFGLAGHRHIVENFESNLVVEKTIKLCEILLKNLSRPQTISELHKLSIKTRCEDATIKALNENIMGSVSLRDKIILKLLQNPIFYKNYLKLKKISSQ